ncbi:acyltransferase [Rothia amarae]|uniref:acyltransferase n=1 Tax=Rothia amarae TaxID=169480 RepID=UPI001EE3AA8A|nr:DapH/DapD/GlmU-related protein [Rothia amarae]
MAATWGTKARQQITQLLNHCELVPGAIRAEILRRLGHKNIGNAFINPGSTFPGFGTAIGDGTFINREVFFDDSELIIIGKNVGIGPRTCFLTGSHHIGPATHRIEGGGNHQPIVVEDGCWLGGNVTVLPGVTIGRGCVIAAGAVVTKSCEPNGLYAGVPARRIRDLDE